MPTPHPSALRRCLASLVLLCLAVAPAASAVYGPGWEALAAHAEASGGLHARAAAFLHANAPGRDADLSADLLRTNLDLALRAREAFPWGESVPEDLFLNDVLPYAVFDETREDWRTGMFDLAGRIVRDSGATTIEQAAQAINRELFNAIDVHYNTGRKRPNQSPAESIAQGRATCTGLTILLVDACRSVGIPARAAGVASWTAVEGNHTWAEIWDGERWRYTGADEFDPAGLDRGWFTGRAKQAIGDDPEHAVWATSWRRTGTPFPLVWDRESADVSAVNVTARYTGEVPAASAPPEPSADEPAAILSLRAWDGGERRAVDVRLIGPDGSTLGTAVTRAGRHDLNDMPALRVPASRPVTVETDDGTGIRVTRLVPEAGETTVDLRLGEMSPVLSEPEAEDAVRHAWRALAASLPEPGEAIPVGGHTLRLLEQTFGKAPEGERSLWISMHGGGGAPAEVNDQQWRNQIRLYEPAEGLYVAPRAPTDTWNLWHQGHIDPLFDALIASYVATRGVDPDRVYLMGYSAGGDGVYQLAPRMADRFAAAAMMAGHPNETTPEGLRNLPFAVFMGGKDAAYNRNETARAFGDRLAALRAADPGGYPHRVTIYPEHGHWMNGDDREALPWMASHARDAWPSRVVWKQDDVAGERLYWLGVPRGEATARNVMAATVEGQTITIEPGEARSATLYLRDELIDLDRPITVRVDDRTVYSGMVRRTRDAIERSLAGRADPRLAATAIVDLSW